MMPINLPMTVKSELRRILKSGIHDLDVQFYRSTLKELRIHDLSKFFPRILVHLEGEIELCVNGQTKTVCKPVAIIVGQGNSCWWKEINKSEKTPFCCSQPEATDFCCPPLELVGWKQNRVGY